MHGMLLKSSSAGRTTINFLLPNAINDVSILLLLASECIICALSSPALTHSHTPNQIHIGSAAIRWCDVPVVHRDGVIKLIKFISRPEMYLLLPACTLR